MPKESKSFKRKVFHAGGWQLARRIAKSVPYLGSVLAIGLVGHDIKKKGFARGVLNSGIDAIPIVRTVKNLAEFVTGDFIPDKDTPEKKRPVIAANPAAKNSSRS